jgi:uncharacterized protein YmfQ (DUF2313 family)
MNTKSNAYREILRSTIQNLPLWKGFFIEETNLYKLHTIICDFFANEQAMEEKIVNTFLLSTDDENLIDKNLLSLMEKQYGLPDDIFDIADNIKDRVATLRVKMRFARQKIDLYKQEDLNYIASLFGIDKITRTDYGTMYGRGFPLPTVGMFFSDDQQMDWYWIISLPASNEIEDGFPLPTVGSFPSNSNIGNTTKLQKLLDKLKPSYVFIEYQYTL